MTQEKVALAAVVARELGVRVSQVDAAIELLDHGATVPFIARYRKEVTDSLDDTQLRVINERLYYLRELDARREVVLQAIRNMDKLTKELEQAILSADTKARLADLYLPYRQKQRTKASLAEEAGLLPLADCLLQNPDKDPQVEAEGFINIELGVGDVPAALEGARQILMERFSEDAALLQMLRDYLWENGILKATGAKGKNPQQDKYADYFDYAEAIKKIPSHRALALFRGRREQSIRFHLALPEGSNYGETALQEAFRIQDLGRPADAWLLETANLTWKTKLFRTLELELFARVRELADDEAIRVFSCNLRALLMAAPAGQVVTMGLDPGLRSGIKVVVVDETGKFLDNATIFPFSPQQTRDDSITVLAKMIAKFNVKLISIGNGTGSRETTQLVAELAKRYPDMHVIPVLVSEAGASVYSASALAAAEFPDLDVTLRGAVSIARRLQDPLAELVKIEPKAIGVGQYQHDVNQVRLARRLRDVVEACVNTIGVDVNTASPSLLTYVSGFNETLAQNIVQYRNEHGPFKNRQQLKVVDRMGEKTFQHAAGFLRIVSGDNPLDASAVHPESYDVVMKIADEQALSVQELIGNVQRLHALEPASYADEHIGLITIKDIIHELEKPGRDPRGEFKTPRFKEGVEDIKDLQIGMVLEGAVTNVTNFGAFVDVGVHHDGLVHISAMTQKFIRDPHQILKVGDVVSVKVIEVDVVRRRIGLSMKLTEEKSTAVRPKVLRAKPILTPVEQAPVVEKSSVEKLHPRPKKRVSSEPLRQSTKGPVNPFNTAMADAFAKLKRGQS